MNKKSTLLAAALMAVSSFMANAAGITPDKCEKGNYYYLTTGDGIYLSLHGLKADSVEIKKLPSVANAANIASRDSALWEIIKEESGSDVTYYQIKNKKTKAILSFDPTSKAPILGEGASKWIISDAGFYAIYEGKEKLYLSEATTAVNKETNGKQSGLELGNLESGSLKFSLNSTAVEFELGAEDINSGFDSFKFSFGGQFEDNVFEGKDLIAVRLDGDTEGYVRLQVKGQEQKDGRAMYLGVDTTSLNIAGATGAYGAVFKLDSTYDAKEGVHSFGNKNFQQFKFTRSLKDDSLAIEVLAAPDFKEKGTEVSKIPVVYTTFNNKKYLTVGGGDQGLNVFFAVQQPTSSSIAKSGVYFLKSASKGENGGKYIKSYNQGTKTLEFMEDNAVPSVHLLKGQWYVKSESGLYKGMYSIADRATDSNILLKGEVFEVKGMPNTYTFGASGDSITLEYQDVDLRNKYLGSAYFSKEELAGNGYVLNLIPNGMDESELFVFDSESYLQIKSGDVKNAVIFKLDSAEKAVVVGGAKSLQDVVSIMPYKLKSRFDDKYIVKDGKKFKLGDEGQATEFRFISSSTGGKYAMSVGDKYVSSDAGTSDMQESEDAVYFKLQDVEAPLYGTIETGHKRLTSDGKSLTMNPLNFFAEAKLEGQDILKSTYEKDNFSLWTIKSDASTPEKPLYFITTSLPTDPEKPEGDRTRYYMAFDSESSRVKFVTESTIKDITESAENPALFALKVTESGLYLLENQKEATSAKPYVGIVNNVVVMTKDGVEFSVETAPAPVANEEIEAPTTVKVIGGVGEFSIRNAHGKKITVSNILGQTIATRIVSSDYVTVPTTRGVVIVSVEGDKAYKVIVK